MEGLAGLRASESEHRAPGGCGTRESLGTELGEARAESRRGRTSPRLIAEGGLSHGVHVRALPRKGKGSLRKSALLWRESSSVGGSRI